MTDASGAWLDKAFEHLEWPRLRDHVLEHCHGSSARRRGLPIATTRDAAQRQLEKTGELLHLLRAGQRPPLTDLRDVEPHLDRLARDGVLDAAALTDVLTTLHNARQLRAFIAEHRDQLPRVSESCQSDPSLDRLEEALRACLLPDGSLSDEASPALRTLRREIGDLRERIVGRLEDLIGRYEAVLSDRYYTLREGRYVLPVRRDAHERVHGIVHATSASGATIFVEPRAVVAHGNRLKMADAEREHEELRIVAELSERTREHLPSLRGAMDALDHLDLINACARFGEEIDGSVPALSDDAEASLQAVRHPLLVLSGIDVVDNDVTLRPERGLVISGPNAGGKTVLLKTLGLAALMARSGLPLPAADGSRIGFFDKVLTDVGDEQSTQNNLSTFSAHIRNLSAILDQAAPSTLVLLDEVATGTDPEEGSALACAVVETLRERGATLAVTTHYEPLKALSLRDPGLRSASVGFDVATMAPSFKLLLDVPGASSALSVAGRFGIPPSVIARAQSILPEQSLEFERLVRELAERAQHLAQAERALANERSELAEVRRRAREALREQRKRGDDEVGREVSALLDDVKRARTELERARKGLRGGGASRAQVQEASARINEIGSRVALGGDLATKAAPPTPTPRPEVELEEGEIRAGLSVYVPRLRSEGVVLEGPHRGRTRVAAGPLKLWVRNDELRSLAGREQDKGAATDRRATTQYRRDRTPDNTLNVRGMRVDDALTLVETFVDRLHASDESVGYVLHGHGTGALRDAVRAHLQEIRYALHDIGPGEAKEGGDAVTVFHLD